VLMATVISLQLLESNCFRRPSQQTLCTIVSLYRGDRSSRPPSHAPAVFPPPLSPPDPPRRLSLLLLLPVPTHARPPGPAATFSRFTTVPTLAPTGTGRCHTPTPHPFTHSLRFRLPCQSRRPFNLPSPASLFAPSDLQLRTSSPSLRQLQLLVQFQRRLLGLVFSFPCWPLVLPVRSFLSSRLVSHRTALPVTVGGSTLRRRSRPLELLLRSQQHSICHLFSRDRFYAGFLDFIHR
jgi:hypothetical protein